MINNDKVIYWTELSDYDFETAIAMLNTGRYLYVGFMCHQVIEKIFKALYSKLKEDMPPYSHKLTYLAIQGGFDELFTEEQQKFIDQLEPLNIKTRYPDYKKELVKKLTQEKCREILDNTKTLQQWIKEQLL